jgi:ABC-type multidrug transport system fused ATPase/permease subunit
MNEHSSNLHDKKIIRKWIYEIFKIERPKFFLLVFWSFMLSLANGAVVLILGPVLRSFFSEFKPGEKIGIRDFLSEWKNVLPPEEVYFEYSFIVLAVPVSLAVIAVIRSIILNRFMVSQDKFALSFTNNYRTKLFSTILRLPYQSVSKKSPSEWMSYLINDVQFLQTRVSELLKVSIKETTMIVGILFGLMIIDFRITLLLIGLSLPLSFYGFRLGKKISKFTQMAQRVLSELSGIVGHLRKSYWYFRSQNAETAELKGFTNFNQKYYSAIKKSIAARSILTPGLEFMGTTALCSVLIYFQFFSASKQPDYMFQIIISMGLIMRPLRALGDQLAKFGELKGALKHTFDAIIELERSDSKAEKNGDISKTSKLSFPVNIDNISFSSGDKEIFNFKGLKLNAGETVAIVGPSGSGKSSFMKVLAGLYKPDTFNSNVELSELFMGASYVSQNPFFFTGTVKENLSYHNPKNIAQGEMEKILKSLKIKESTSILDSNVATGTKEVSQGQLQRLTIARSMLRDKCFLLFDEASSALDETTEKEVVSYIRDFTKSNDKSTLWITHRLELLDQFDRIWLIENGKLIEISANDKEMLSKIEI